MAMLAAEAAASAAPPDKRGPLARPSHQIAEEVLSRDIDAGVAEATEQPSDASEPEEGDNATSGGVSGGGGRAQLDSKRAQARTAAASRRKAFFAGPARPRHGDDTTTANPLVQTVLGSGGGSAPGPAPAAALGGSAAAAASAAGASSAVARMRATAPAGGAAAAAAAASGGRSSRRMLPAILADSDAAAGTMDNPLLRAAALAPLGLPTAPTAAAGAAAGSGGGRSSRRMLQPSVAEGDAAVGTTDNPLLRSASELAARAGAGAPGVFNSRLTAALSSSRRAAASSAASAAAPAESADEGNMAGSSDDDAADGAALPASRAQEALQADAAAPTLPAGWLLARDNEGDPYYYQEHDPSIVVWTLPTEPAPAVPGGGAGSTEHAAVRSAAVPRLPPLPVGWTEAFSKTQQKNYWYHSDGRTAWTRP